MKYLHLGLHFDEFQLKISKFRIEIRFPKSDFRHSEQIKLISMTFKGITLPNDVKNVSQHMELLCIKGMTRVR